jgi:serine/threonine protein kinase
MALVFRPGDRCGPYEIVRPLGEGGMGEVHLARGPGGERRALKVLSPTAQQNRELTKRFLGEIQVLSYLEHAHVVRFYETGSVERDGQTVLWLALEFLEGQTLREVQNQSRGTLDEDAIIRWGRQIAQGVHEAHKLNVIHRDLKPENVIVVGDGMAKVIDFGIAKFRDWGDTRSRTSGARIGTLLYMAPEQLDDALGIPIDARTDVYGLGVILYELAIGRHPYVEPGVPIEMATLLVRKLASDLPPVCSLAPRLSSELGEVIDRACQHDARRRYESMEALFEALGAVWRRKMDERRERMLGGGRASTPSAPPAATPPAAPVVSQPTQPTAWHAPPEGQSSRFESVRTLPEVESPLRATHARRDAALLGAVLGIASGLVLYRAEVAPRLAEGRGGKTAVEDAVARPSSASTGRAGARAESPAADAPSGLAASVASVTPSAVSPAASTSGSATAMAAGGERLPAPTTSASLPRSTFAPSMTRAVPTGTVRGEPSPLLIHPTPSDGH